MYSFTSRVRYSECDKDATLTLAGLLNYLQDTAILHSDDAGVGLTYMKDRHMAWFVTTYHLEIKRLPKASEVITTATYPYRFHGFIGCRAFTVKDEKGELLAVCDSSWALMDLDTLYPLNASDEMVAAYKICDVPEGTPASVRLRPEKDLDTIGSFTVTRDMLDTNNHVNNGKYLTLMQDYLPEDLAVHDIKIAYKKALHLGDEVQVKIFKYETTVKIYFYRGEELSCIGEFEE